MDPFEVRMQFLTLLRRLNASQQSIQKIVGFALKYFSRCGDDLWECIVEECQKGTLNTRINILYLLDNLCEASLTHQVQAPKVPRASTSSANMTNAPGSYVQYVARDLGKIVKLVVPETRVGLVNLMSARQILDSWRSKRILDPALVDDLLASLRNHEENLRPISSSSSLEQKETSEFPKDEVLRRFEEDRERHKLLRQKRWHVPVPAHVLNPLASQPLLPKFSSALSLHPPLPTVPSPSRDSLRTDQLAPGDSSTTTSDIVQPQSAPTHVESALDIEFDNAWETTSDWNEDDEDAADEENLLCFGPPQPQRQMEEEPIAQLIDGREQEAAVTETSDARQHRQHDFALASMNGRENAYPSVPPHNSSAPTPTLETLMPPSYPPRFGPSRGAYAPQGPGRGIGNGTRTGTGGHYPSTTDHQMARDAHASGHMYPERPLGHRRTWGSVNQYEQQQSGPRVWPPPTAPQSMMHEQPPASSYYQNGPSTQQGGYYGGPGGGGYSMNGR